VDEVDGKTWLKFYIYLTDIPPTSSPCKDADLFKVEFSVGEFLLHWKDFQPRKWDPYTNQCHRGFRKKGGKSPT